MTQLAAPQMPAAPAPVAPVIFNPRLARRRALGWLFAGLCLAMSLFAFVILFALLTRVWMDGAQFLSWRFLTEFPSQLEPTSSGIKNALWGTIWLIAWTAAFSVPIGVGAAIYLEEYAAHNWLTRFIQLNISNLAGVPAIVYGILGLTLFVRWLHLGQSILAGSLTMTLLVLPVVIIASREALAAVPKTIRLAAYALGATRWQTIRHHVLPAAVPGIMTGLILSLSRAIGEAAPLVVIGALAYVNSVPESWWDDFTVLPIQIFNWSSYPDPIFQNLAATAILVLLVILLAMNATAIVIRAARQKGRRQ